jgi:hypothetical protein
MMILSPFAAVVFSQYSPSKMAACVAFSLVSSFRFSGKTRSLAGDCKKIANASASRSAKRKSGISASW